MIIENSVVLKITDADVNDGVLCLPDEATVLKADVTGISSPMRSKIRELRGNNIQSIEAFTDHCGKRSALTPTFPALELFNMPKLKEIPKEAFVQHKMLKKVELSSVKYVREMAFEDSCIETVILPEVKIIEDQAFDECSDLNELNFPNVRLIGKEAFQNCNKLIFIEFSKATNIQDGAFKGCKALEKVVLPAIQFIGASAFLACKNLNRACLGDSLKVIERMAFSACAITELKLGKDAVVEPAAFEDPQDNMDVYCDVPEQIDGVFGFFPNGRKVRNVYLAKKYTEGQKLPFLTNNECSYLVFPNKRMRVLSANTSQVFEVEQEIACVDGKILWILHNGSYAVKGAYGRVIKYCSTKEELEETLNASPF